MSVSKHIISQIEKKIGAVIYVQSVGGGCIAQSYTIVSIKGTYFLKTNYPCAEMYKQEALGLLEIAKSNTIATPLVIDYTNDYLLIEYIESSPITIQCFKTAGKQLARMHMITHSKCGFSSNNFIGKSIQINTQHENWAHFFYTNRIQAQLVIAQKNNKANQELIELVEKSQDPIIEMLEVSPQPHSLLHGDLWSGNILSNTCGTPYLVDTAVYYGNRESDIAMTTLFGGFPPEFYSAYNQEYPLNTDYVQREKIYQLYHIFNHYNLFGIAYYNRLIHILKHITK